MLDAGILIRMCFYLQMINSKLPSIYLDPLNLQGLVRIRSWAFQASMELTALYKSRIMFSPKSFEQKLCCAQS